MNCLIVDDDPLICDLLEHFCSKIEQIRSVTTTNSGFESVNLINQNDFDLILLDYDLPDLTGKEILQVIANSCAVIMITAQKDFASESYNYDQIVDYLVKPIEFPRFFKAIQKVQAGKQQTKGHGNSLFVKDGNKLVKIQLEDVLFIKSAANYAELVFEDRKLMTLMTLKELEGKLPDWFQRVHRSYIVNVNKIDAIASGDVHVGNEEISLSSQYEQKLLDKIKLLN